MQMKTVPPAYIRYQATGLLRFRADTAPPHNGGVRQTNFAGLVTLFFLSFCVYVYPCTILCDVLFLGVPPKIFSSLHAITMWAALFVVYALEQDLV